MQPKLAQQQVLKLFCPLFSAAWGTHPLLHDLFSSFAKGLGSLKLILQVKTSTTGQTSHRENAENSHRLLGPALPEPLNRSSGPAHSVPCPVVHNSKFAFCKYLNTRAKCSLFESTCTSNAAKAGQEHAPMHCGGVFSSTKQDIAGRLEPALGTGGSRKAAVLLHSSDFPPFGGLHWLEGKRKGGSGVVTAASIPRACTASKQHIGTLPKKHAFPTKPRFHKPVVASAKCQVPPPCIPAMRNVTAGAGCGATGPLAPGKKQVFIARALILSAPIN